VANDCAKWYNIFLVAEKFHLYHFAVILIHFTLYPFIGIAAKAVFKAFATARSLHNPVCALQLPCVGVSDRYEVFRRQKDD
jgi:hypothetical protein